MIKNSNSFDKGFTLVELMVSVAIFAFMTAFLVAKYGTFNQGILLTNLAYDVALTIRNAQSYGLNVKSKPIENQSYSTLFDYPYGVHFETGANNKIMIFFADSTADGKYVASNNELITSYNIKRGSYVSALCAGTGPGASCAAASSLDVTFKRPDPNAIIKKNGETASTFSYSEITLVSTDGGVKKVAVRSTGQITVCDNNNVCN